MRTNDLALSRLLVLLAGSALGAECVAGAERRRASRDLRSSRRAVLVIELRLQLDEQVLLPALHTLRVPSVDAAAGRIEVLRELLADAVDGDLPLPNHRRLWATIDRLCGSHFDAVAALTLSALQGGRLDEAQVLREVRAYQARWRQEIAQTGDIENEGADPVGQPPRSATPEADPSSRGHAPSCGTGPTRQDGPR